MTKIQISIITVCKNSESTIRDTLNSVSKVLNGNHNVEYIIQDSLSIDSTLEIVKEYSKKINNLRIFSERDTGLYEGMNNAISRCTGKYVLFLNSDDILLNQFNSFLDFTIKNKNIDFYTAPVVFFRRPNYKIKRVFLSYPERCNPIKNLILSYVPAHPGFICDLDLLMKTPFDTNYKGAADYNQLLQITLKSKNKRKNFNKPIIAMAMGGQSNTFRGFKIAMAEMKKINKKFNFKEKLYLRYIRNVLQHIFPLFLNKKLDLVKITKELEDNSKIVSRK